MKKKPCDSWKKSFLHYITKVKKKLKLPQNQVACLIWDAFKAQSTEKVKLEEHLNIKDVEVPKNMTHLLQL